MIHILILCGLFYLMGCISSVIVWNMLEAKPDVREITNWKYRR